MNNDNNHIINNFPKSFNNKKYEILFVEKVDDTQSLLIHCKDKCSIDLEGKELIVFFLE